MFSGVLFWPWFIGLVFLIAGLIVMRREFARAPGLDKIVVIGPVLYAVPLAVFGTEHLVSAKFIMQIVPTWMPGRLFWAYFVGVALIAAAVSLIWNRYVRLSATLLAIMFLLFVVLIHAPRVVAIPHDRFAWAVVLRDLSFGAGALALAGSRGSSAFVVIGRLCVAIALLFFGIENFLHPESAPGVPLEKLMPAWVPFGPLWAYLTGAILLAGGVSLLVNKWTRTSASYVGLWVTILTVFLYLPILLMATKGSEVNEGVNYVADTLLFAGTVLLVAVASPVDETSSAIRATA